MSFRTENGWVQGERVLALWAWLTRVKHTLLFGFCISGLGMFVVMFLDGIMMNDFPQIKEAVVAFCIVIPLLGACAWAGFRLQHRPISALAVRPRWGGIDLIAAPPRHSGNGGWRIYNIRFIMFRAFDAMEFTIPCEYQGRLCQAVMEIRNGWIRMKGFRELTARERWAIDSKLPGYTLLDPRATYDYETSMLIVKQP